MNQNTYIQLQTADTNDYYNHYLQSKASTVTSKRLQRAHATDSETVFSISSVKFQDYLYNISPSGQKFRTLGPENGNVKFQ